MNKYFETSYQKWRHIKDDYVVKILEVHHYNGAHGLYSTVTVEGSRRSPKAKVTWSAENFKKLFKPVGKKTANQTSLDKVLANSKRED